VPLAKVRDRSVRGEVVRAEHTEGHVLVQLGGDLPRREGAGGVGVDQHHPGVEGLVARAFVAVARLELAQIHRIDGVRQKEGQVVFRQPIAQRRRKQKTLIGLVSTIIARHDRIERLRLTLASAAQTPRGIPIAAPRRALRCACPTRRQLTATPNARCARFGGLARAIVPPIRSASPVTRVRGETPPGMFPFRIDFFVRREALGKKAVIESAISPG